MYVIHTRYYLGRPASMHLYEMTRKQFLAKVSTREPNKEDFFHINARIAHGYVRTGSGHSTALYVDETTGRIRRATDSH